MKRTLQMLTAIMFLMVPSLLFAEIIRSPEAIIDLFFKGWKLQNQTYMESIGTGELSDFGKKMSTTYLRDYSIVWSEKIRDYTLMKIDIKIITTENGLTEHSIYFILQKVDGRWKWMQGFVYPKGRKEFTGRQVLELYFMTLYY